MRGKAKFYSRPDNPWVVYCVSLTGRVYGPDLDSGITVVASVTDPDGNRLTDEQFIEQMHSPPYVEVEFREVPK